MAILLRDRGAVSKSRSSTSDSEEKHEPVSDIDTAAADGLKVLDPKRPIKEADIHRGSWNVRFGPGADISHFDQPDLLIDMIRSAAVMSGP